MTASHDPTDVSGLEAIQAGAAARERRVAELEAADFKWLAGNKRGRRIIHRLLSKCGVWRTSFTGNSTTFFNEGQRNIGLMVLEWMHEHAPEAYVQMLQEHKANRNERTNDTPAGQQPSDH